MCVDPIIFVMIMRILCVCFCGIPMYVMLWGSYVCDCYGDPMCVMFVGIL